MSDILVAELNEAIADCASNEHQFNCICNVAQEAIVSIVELRARCEALEEIQGLKKKQP